MGVRYDISIFVLILLCNGPVVVVRSQELLTTVASQVKNAFDNQFYESFIDDELCDQQTALLVDKSLDTPFLDASSKIPSGILTGNKDDLGDYHQCIGIRYDDLNIQGKYCAMHVPFHQFWPSIPDKNNVKWTNISKQYFSPPYVPNVDLPESLENGTLTHNNTPKESISTWDHKRYNLLQQLTRKYDVLPKLNPGMFPSLGHIKEGFNVAICIPKACSSQRGLKFLQKEISVNISATETYCRLSDDKPFVAGDFVAIAFFSLLGLLNVMSTIYDIVTKFYFKRESSDRSTLLCSFSVYTNTRRLLTFSSGPGQLDCIDGIRTISMMWIVIGHTYPFTSIGYVHNIFHIIELLESIGTVWIAAVSVNVDTFFVLTGILIVYTTMSKVCRAHFFRNLHMFYLHRLLRMFPLLAAQVLFQATLAHHVADGPFWVTVASHVQNCRDWWWSTLLYVQNYVNPVQTCVMQTWYLAVDTQLYFASPLVLWFLWGHRRSAWAALGISLLLSLIYTTIIIFMSNFTAAVGNIRRLNELSDYLSVYYFNTLARAPAFIIGMAYGYMLHVYRCKDIQMSKIIATLLWVLALLVIVLCILSFYFAIQPDHTAQAFDNFLNAYMRAIWAAAVGWLIFACAKGYGGPVNWFLSLQMWKLPSRLSYAMYLQHVIAIILVNGTWVKPHYGTFGEMMYRYISDVTIAFIAAFVVSITIDAPFSTLQKLLFADTKKTSNKSNINSEARAAEPE